MTQQDYTAPELPVKVSRKEHFRLGFQVFDGNEQTPATSLSPMQGSLLDASGFRLATATTSQPAPNAVVVELSTVQMVELRPGRYRLEVYSVVATERTDLVTILMTVV